jgi:signal peptidase II
MLLAGVLGNMFDRILFGYVRDMIHALPRWPKLFPWIFNVADSLLCVGVFLMIVYSFVHRPQSKPALQPQS